MSAYDGGPAFPDQEPIYRSGYETGEFRPVRGMTLRDYFAAKALAAMLANPNKDGRNCGKDGLKLFPEFAYEWADAMLRARGEA